MISWMFPGLKPGPAQSDTGVFMSHGGGGGFGHGGGGGGHHGGLHHGGGEPDSSVSWNMAYVGDKRTGKMANFNPLPIFIGLVVFSVMILPFVLDWNEPHLQRMLIGHDLTAKEIAHQNAVDQAMAGMMRSQALKSFGPEIGGTMIPDPGPASGSSLIAEPPSPSSIPDDNQPSAGGGLAGFSITANSAAQQPSQSAGLSAQMAPAQSYMPNNGQPNYGQTSYPQAGAGMAMPQVPPTVGFNNQRFISQPSSGAYFGPGSGSVPSPRGIDYHAPRHKVVVDR